MSKIRILPEQLANQIAAGEVVERPASVVKELVENSLDASASRIEIEIEGGGTRLIRIIDNGVGMEEDDLLMSLERHGTSKIQKEEDLGTINTLGFRGEAVPSIGSVSKLTMTSRVTSNELGTRVVLEYGKLTKVHEIGCSFGTTVEVRSLFGNTPARRKFLRTTRTEVGHIEEVVKNYALGCPEVTFILRLDGRDSLYLDGTLSLEKRLGNLMRYDGAFIPVSSSQSTPQKRQLSGFLIPPEKVTVGPAKLRLFVNGRAVRDRMVAHAVTEGLRGFLMKGKNPSGLIHLELSPGEIDVNVHPAKHEIRFINSKDVHTFLSQSVSGAMSSHQQQLQSTIFHRDQLPGRVPIPSTAQGGEEASYQSSAEETVERGFDNQSTPHIDHRSPISQISHRDPQTIQVETEAPQPSPEKPVPPPASKISVPAQSLLATAEPIKQSHGDVTAVAEQSEMQPESTPQAQQGAGHNLLVIGQFDDLYIFCRNSEGLIVIDQHAAHERLLYEKLQKQYLQGKVARQTLMFPETVELSLFQAQLVEKNSEELDRIGFSIRDFGGDTFIISAVPALAGTINGRQLFLDILEQFGSENNRSSQGGLLDTILATMACKAAVKAGTKLSHPEIYKLLDEMARADLFSHCPHGRPVVKQFSKDDVKKWFYRT